MYVVKLYLSVIIKYMLTKIYVNFLIKYVNCYNIITVSLNINITDGLCLKSLNWLIKDELRIVIK